MSEIPPHTAKSGGGFSHSGAAYRVPGKSGSRGPWQAFTAWLTGNKPAAGASSSWTDAGASGWSADGWSASPARGISVGQRPPWSLWDCLWVLLAFGASLPLFSLLGTLLMSPWLDPGLEREQAQDQILMVVMPVTLVLAHAVGWGMLFLLISGRRKLPLFSSLGMGNLRWGPAARVFVAGMVFQFVGLVFLAGAAQYFPPPEDLSDPIWRFFALGPWAVAFIVFMAVVMAPLLEEALMRGMLFPALRGRMGFLSSAFLVSALFTALHGIQNSWYWPMLAGLFMIGWILAWLKEKGGSLWLPIFFHMGFNATAMVLAINEKT